MGTSRFAIPSGRWGWRQAGASLACVALLSGCEGATAGVERFYDSKLTLDRPVDWWHQLQGGPVAHDRPPPPGITDPYPNFAAIPARPTPIDPATRQSLLTRMIAQRDQATRQATRDPIAFPGSATAAAAKAPAPKLPTPKPADAETSTMTLDAASAPTPAAAAAPEPKTPIDPHPPRAFANPLQPAAPVTSGPIPAVPTTAPSLPQLAGLPISTPEPVVVRAKPSAAVRFAPGSAALPATAEAALRSLVARRAGGTVSVQAGGEARSAALDAQREALPLALRRTGAITAALIAAGVPAASIRAEATAQGRDASARLLD